MVWFDMWEVCGIYLFHAAGFKVTEGGTQAS